MDKINVKFERVLQIIKDGQPRNYVLLFDVINFLRETGILKFTYLNRWKTRAKFDKDWYVDIEEVKNVCNNITAKRQINKNSNFKN